MVYAGLCKFIDVGVIERCVDFEEPSTGSTASHGRDSYLAHSRFETESDVGPLPGSDEGHNGTRVADPAQRLGGEPPNERVLIVQPCNERLEPSLITQFRQCLAYLKSLQTVLVLRGIHGLERCGEWFDCENLGITPDILVFSKTSGNGYPSSGVLISDTINERLLEKGFHHLSSHQNDPLTATAVGAVIDIIRDNSYLDQCKENGEYFLASLNELAERRPNLSGVRGRGLMIAFDLLTTDSSRRPYAEMLNPFVLTCKSKGVHLTYTYYEGVIRIIPAINIERKDIDFAIEVLDQTLDDLEKGNIKPGQVEQKNKVIKNSLKQRKVKRTLNRLWETSPEYWLKKLRKK